MQAEEKLNALKNYFKEQQEQILKQIIRDAPPYALLGPQSLAPQLIMGLRSTIEILKKLDDKYELTPEELTKFFTPEPVPKYIG